MTIINDQVQQFLEQEIELYGDDFVVSREPLSTALRPPAPVQKNTVICSGSVESGIAVALDTTRPEESEPDAFWNSENGELLSKILASVDFDRNKVLLFLLVKGDDTPQSVASITSQLIERLQTANPAFILCFGKTAGQILYKSRDDVDNMRGKVQDYNSAHVIVTHHPAILINNSRLKRETWEDMKMLQRLYNNRTQVN
ncbi:MAG TPA: uracil-DNA glycosylase family protein [bacterium]|nr:uracil-DNA glycosylase family protein [bacterium]HPN43108.1 uracil-DNA glycosylase family protein [bacterium]